jgi:FKBP-type peptidyl-prolyl cis-trans isomerase FkpA
MLQHRFLRALTRRSLVQTALLAPLAALAIACGSDDPAPTGNSVPSSPATETFASSLGVNIAAMTKKSDNLYIQDLVVGTGAEAIVGRTVRLHYTGWLANGTQFETSIGGQPLDPFVLGSGRVIPGWDQGIPGMRVGGKRRLVIGSALAYGPTGQGKIGPNQTLIFDVELVSAQ